MLAAFFLGLAAGSYLAERLTRRTDMVRSYLILEAVIGISGLVLLPVLLRLDALLAIWPAVGTTTLAKFVLTLVLLAAPTLCMGATFPVMAALLVRTHGDFGARIGHLYSLNTFGAVLGAGLCGFVFIPSWGLTGAIRIAAACNLGIVAMGLLLVGGLEGRPPATTDAAVADEPPTHGRSRTGEVSAARAALAVLFVTGFVSIAAEVAWTKYLAIFTGTTMYGFAAILTVFLTGIAVGSWLARSLIDRLEHPTAWLPVALTLLGTAMLLTRTGLTFAPTVHGAIVRAEHLRTIPWVPIYAYLFAVLIAPTLLFGALFPLTLRMYCATASGVRGRVGHAYAVNTFAGILGSLAAGFWLIPTYGTDLTLAGLACATAACGWLVFSSVPHGARRVAAAAAPLLVLLAAVMLPALDYRPLINSVEERYNLPGGEGAEPPRFVFLREGKAAVVSVVTRDDRMAVLQSNGLSESRIDMVDPRYGNSIEVLLGLIPYFLHPDPRTGFVVGFGGGNTALGLAATKNMTEIDVVELEPAVVEAVEAATQGSTPALLDPRVTVRFNDARNTLLVEDRRYDLIVSQPSHPWVAGAGNLFTVEFFEIVRSRLAQGGIFGQWLNLFQMDGTTLRSILRAFYEVFPHGAVFTSPVGADLLLFGSEAPVVFDRMRVEDRMSTPELSRLLGVHDLGDPVDLLALFALSRADALAIAGNAEPNSDANLISEVRLAGFGSVDTSADDPKVLVDANARYDVISYLPPQSAARDLAALENRLLKKQRARKAGWVRDRMGQLTGNRRSPAVNASP